MVQLGIENVQKIPSRIEGQILLYTGEGKGKSQCALGLALRMIGLGISNNRKNKVLIVRFLKGGNKEYSEDIALKAIKDSYPHLVEIINTGTGNFLYKDSISDFDLNEANKAWTIAKGAIFSDLYSLVILDEINPSVDLGLIEEQEVINFLNKVKRSKTKTEIVLTGVNSTKKLIDLSDLHSEIKNEESSTTKKGYTLENYIGNGKGKSTSALGKCLKYVGENKKVLIVQFLKGGKGYTEDAVLKVLMDSFQKRIDHFHCGRSVIVFKGKEEDADFLEAQKGWAIAKAGIKGGNYDLVILDEINPTLDLELINKEEVISFLKEEHNCDIITTGRCKDIDPNIKTYNFFCHKHYSDKGINLRDGIDF